MNAKTTRTMLTGAALLAFAGSLFGCTGISLLTVNSYNDADDGACDATHCSLREAINKVNSLTGTITIHFDIGEGGAQTIQPLSALPNITTSVFIDGTSQPGYSGTPLIVLDGSLAGSASGLTLQADDSTVKGLVINRFLQDGIFIDATNVAIRENYIGTDVTGTAALGNVGSGITVSGNNHQIGASGGGNLISGNVGAGVTVEDPATGVKIQDNKIGTTADGFGVLGNKIGIEVATSLVASSVLIGGSLYGEGNIIGGNLEQGILLSNNAEVTGNLIGAHSLQSIPNGGDGILIRGDNNRIGTPHNPNAIAHSGGHGVAVISKQGDATGNIIDGNEIWDNGGLGIALGGNSVIANDPGDADTGDNLLQNYPVMVTADHDPNQGGMGGTTFLAATLDSAPNTQYTVEFFTNIACDPSGYGEGHQMVASETVTTDGSGHADVTDLYQNYHFIDGDFITATAIGPAGNTSGFSQCIPITELDAAPANAAMTFAPFIDPAEIFYGRGGCTPTEVRIGVEIGDPPEAISYVLLFVRLLDPATGETGFWSEGLSMMASGENAYFYDLLAEDVPEYPDFAEAVLQYQFVVYNGAQEVIGRSEVYGDVTVKRCGVPGMAG